MTAGDSPDSPTAMNNATGKRLLALIRDADYAHPGEEQANDLLFAGVRPDTRRRILDAGCGGAGTAAWVQARELGVVTGVEIDARTAEIARSRHPEVTVVEGDLQRAGEVLQGPFDLIYSMTAVYAVPDQPAAFRELGALAAPGAELRLLDYADPDGRFAAATAGDPSRGWWHPLRPTRLPELLETAGWSSVEVRDLRPEFVLWYQDLCRRIAAKHDDITREFGREWYAFAAREYAGVLDMVRAGELGGVLVRARAPSHSTPLRGSARGVPHGAPRADPPAAISVRCRSERTAR
jgi:SAM-dependent methyltransferase